MAKAKIYYPAHMPRNPGRHFADPDMGDHVGATYQLVAEVEDNDLEYIFAKLQDSGAAALGIRSLSVGDIVVSDELERPYICVAVGFRELPPAVAETIQFVAGEAS